MSTTSGLPWPTVSRGLHLSYLQAALVTLVMLLGVWTLLITAWVCDDAYISFRVVDNFANGYGLRWNVDERVQVFSNPLWTLLLLAPYAWTGEIYYTSIVISGLATLGCLWTTLHCGRYRGPGVIAALALLLSPTFVAFSTSGLENSLTHALVGLFCTAYVSDRIWPRRKALALTLLVSFACLNRLDNLFLLGVPLIWFVWQHRSKGTLCDVLLGALPLITWEIFALIYYGTPVPNTAYAKLATGIPALELVNQGLAYFRVSARFDPMGAGLILLAIFLVPLINRRLLPVSLGIVLQLAYVLKVGGDFMAGRFFSASIVASAALVAIAVSALASARRRFLLAAMGLGIAGIGASTAQATIASSRFYTPEGNSFPEGSSFQIPASGVIDERKYYYWATGLLSPRRTNPISHPFATAGHRVRQSGVRVEVGGVMGFMGYFAGPQVHIIDIWGLCDPLLARLPALQPWRIGHFERVLPLGYRESLESGRNQLVDPSLAQLFGLLDVATRSPLFAPQRLHAIASLNFGEGKSIARHSLYAAEISCRNSAGKNGTTCHLAVTPPP